MKEEICLMIKLNPQFQREIFQRVIIKYNGSIKASQHISIPASSIRAYKNSYFKTISRKLIDRLIELKITTLKEISSNTLQILNKKQMIEISLNKGRQKRKDYFINLKNQIPSLSEIFIDNKLNLYKWLKAYEPLLNSNLRKVKLTSKNNVITANYNNFTKEGFRNFENKIPKIIRVDNEFVYFFGLWCGDRAGGKRIGICNKNNEILIFTEAFLKKYNQKIEKILYLTKGLSEPNIKYDKKFLIDKESKGWVLSVHSNNGIFSSFFYYLLSNLDIFLSNIKKSEIFFAGLFDAEGNVSLYNKSFRWACKNLDLMKIYSKYLTKLNLYDRYDGNCLVSYNRKDFYNRIFPYLKHNDKINLTKFLCKGTGEMPQNFKDILNFIKNNPLMCAKDISKALKKNKLYFELRILKDFQYIQSESYPNKFKLTNKGKN